MVEAGWSKVENSYIRREVSITPGRIIGGGKRASALSSDYVLEYQGHKLAVVEAKKRALDMEECVRPGLRTASAMPLAYACCARIYQMDMLSGEEKLVDQFLSPKQLWQLTFDLGKTWKAGSLNPILLPCGVNVSPRFL